MLESAPGRKLSGLLGRFGEALLARDAGAAASLFREDGYWRDLVAFTWNIRTMEGRGQIRDMLESQLDGDEALRLGARRGRGCRRRATGCSRAGSASRQMWRAASATYG